MPYDDPDPSDPNVLVGVSLPGDRQSVEEMARAFAEEFAALGYDPGRLLGLFRRPFYAGAHLAWRVLGEDTIKQIVRESSEVWGRYRVRVQEQSSSPLVQISAPEDGPGRARPAERSGPQPSTKNPARSSTGAGTERERGDGSCHE
jgi:hypothetical protein